MSDQEVTFKGGSAAITGLSGMNPSTFEKANTVIGYAANVTINYPAKEGRSI